MVAAQAHTTLSTKGQIVIPKDVRERLGWRPGDEIVVEETADSVVLRVVRADRIDPAVAKAATDEFIRRFRRLYKGPRLSIEDIHRAIGEGAMMAWHTDEHGVLHNSPPPRPRKKQARAPARGRPKRR